MKRIIAWILVMLTVFSLAACSGDQKPEPDDNEKENQSTKSDETKNENDHPSGGNEDVELTEKIAMLGYYVYYQSGAKKDSSDIGHIVEGSDYLLLIETPDLVATDMGANSIEDVPAACESYVINTMELWLSSRFDYAKTKLEEKTREIYRNDSGVELVLTYGVAHNEKAGTSYDYAAAYFLAGADGDTPAYIVGFSIEDGADVAAVVKEMAGKIVRIS